MTYEKHPILGSYVLEDSYVLDILQIGSSLVLRLDLALAENHPTRRPAAARPEMLHDFRAATLTLTSKQPVELQLSGRPPATDVGGEKDYGHIDLFSFVETGHVELEGDWGRARVFEPEISVVMDDDQTG